MSDNKLYPAGTSFTSGLSLSPEEAARIALGIQQSSENRRIEDRNYVGYDVSGLGDAEKYADVGLESTVRLERERREGNLEKILADSQSNWQKTANGLGQTVISEILLGTPKGISDLFDIVINAGLTISGSNEVYENPISKLLRESQEAYKEYAPIYSDPTRNTIADGGLGNWGWWMSNMPSVMSSLTLMIPGEAIGMGLSKLGTLAKAGKLNKAFRTAVGITNAERMELMAKNGITAVTSRLLENHQEAMQVHQDMYKDAFDTLSNMSNEEYNAWLERHQDEFDENFDTSNKDEVAKHIAKKAANETFVDDLWNIAFDVIQVYALRNIGRIRNAPTRFEVREAHKNSIKYLGKLRGEQKELLAKRNIGEKTKDFLDNFIYGAGMEIGAELSEGVEEAINYIAQQEGMHVGNVILEKEQDSPFFKHRLKDYMLAPQLWDSAVWGVLGGITFQGLGSQFQRGKNAFLSKNNKDYNKNETTGEEKNKPSWIKNWELSEVKHALEHIDDRTASYNAYISQIKQIYDDEVNPFSTSDDGTPLAFEKNDDVGKKIASTKAFNSMVDNILLSAIDAGRYNLSKEFLTNDKVINSLIEAGGMSTQDAQSIKETILERAEKIERLYNTNLNAIDNALKGIDKKSNANYADIPLDYIKIIARSNIIHQLNADSFEEEAAIAEDKINTLSKELKDKHPEIDKYRRNIEHLVNTLDYLSKVRELEKLEADKSQNTVTKENVIENLKAQIKNLELYISRDISGSDTNVSRLSRFISAYGRGIVERFNAYPIKHPRREELSKQFENFDNAILGGDIASLKKFNDVFKLLPDDDEGFETLRSASDMAKILNQDLENNVDIKHVYKELSNINEDLAKYYWQASALRNAAAMESSNIDLTRDSIIKRIDYVHNQANGFRKAMIEMANQTLLSLAKQYGYNTIIKYVNDRYLNNKGEGFEDLDINAEINNMSDKHKKELDKSLDILNLSNIENIEIGDKIKRILERAEAIDYASIKTLEELEEENTDNETGESSTGFQNPVQGTENLESVVTSSNNKKTSTESERGQNDTFSTDINNRKLPKSMARITISDDNKITLNQIDLDNPNDKDYSINETDDGNIEIDVTNTNLSNPIFDNNNLFNLNGNSLLDDNVKVTKNPIIFEDENGNYKVLEKGQINKVEEDNSKSAEESDYATSSTGGLTNPITYIENDEDENTKIAEEQANVNLGYDTQSLLSRVSSEAINYFKENKEYAENNIKKYLLDNIKDASHEDILNAFKEVKDWIIEGAKDIGLPIITNATNEIIKYSDILDRSTDDTEKESAKNAMDKAMQVILDEYLKYGALDEVNGKYYINLSNLLSYLNKATNNKYTANVIYDSIVKIINNNKDKYRIVDFNDTKDERLTKANSSQKQYEEIISDNTIHKLNVTSLLSYLKDNLSEEEYNKERAKIYEALDKAQEGDKLDYKVDADRLNIYYNNTRIGSFPVPRITENGKYYTMINRGWKVDVPLNGNYTDSAFYNMLYTLFVNPSNDERVNKVVERLLKYIHRNRNIENIDAFNEAIDSLLNDILSIDESYKDLITDINNNGVEQYNNVDRIDHIVKLFTYVKQVGARKSIENIDVAKKEQYVDLKDAREYSIQQWMDKLKEESDAIKNIVENGSSVLRIATINDSGVNKTVENYPVKDAIGAAHKGNVFVATTILGDNNTLAVAGKEPISVIGEFSGRTRLVIYSKKPWFVNAYPVSFDSTNLDNTEAQVIANEIIEDLFNLFDTWGQKRIPKTFDDIIDFLTKLTVRLNGNQPLVNGLYIDKNKNGSITLKFNKYGKNDAYVNLLPTFTENGKVKNRDLVAYKYGNNASWTRSSSYRANPSHKKALIKLFREYLSFNINPVYAQADNNLNYVHEGFATRNEEGKFVIKIGNHPEHVFDSFNDFIIGQNTIDVNTLHDEYGRNLGIPTVKFEVVDNSTPVEESRTESKTNDLIKKGDKAIELINKNPKTAGRKILDLALSSTQLNELKKSKIIKALTPKNTIFVNEWSDGKNHIAASDENGNLYISKELIKLLNNQEKDSANKHFEAARHIIHEGIHIQLNDKKYSSLIPEIKEIFNAYTKIANSLTPTDSRRRYLYENDVQKDGTRRYHNSDGSINELGLEEFLVESITRPELMELLNEYDINGVKLDTKEGYTPGATTGNLFERIIKALARLFKININEGSILEDEIKLFKTIINNDSNTHKVTENVYNVNNKEEKETSEEEEIDEEEDEDDDDSFFNPTVNYSDILDNSITTPESVTSNMNFEEISKFNKMINNGLINYSCKVL